MKKKTRPNRTPKLSLSTENIRHLTAVKGGLRNQCMSCNDSCASVVQGSCNTL